MDNSEADLELNDYEDDEEELITAQKVLESLELAWSNEMFAPEILPHQNEMVELMLGQINNIGENIKKLDKNDFIYIYCQMELERIRYTIASYLRCRLQKIETYTKHIISEERTREPSEKRLSEEETIYAEEHLANVETYFNSLALQYMPALLRSDAEQRIVRPNLMSHVFIKANVSVPAIVTGFNEEEVDLPAGSQHVVPYQLVSDLIHKDQARLM